MTKAIHFDEKIAPTYDATSASMFDPAVLDPTVEFLSDLAAGRPCLEFAVGTGRVALALSERGLRVDGVELSPHMIEQLQRKPGADRVRVTIGDMATTKLEDRYGLVYLVFNTITNLTTQDDQVECFRNAADHLEPGGVFVIEVGVPDLRRLGAGDNTRVFSWTRDYVGFDEYTDYVEQILYSHHWWTRGAKIGRSSAPYRYVWPSELDLMARLAGMRLRARWADWTRTPFTGESPSHVSVWEKH